MLTRVEAVLQKIERARIPPGPVVISPDTEDELGIGHLRRAGQLDIEFLSGSARPVVGRFIRWTKKLLRWSLRWWIGPISNQQTAFNLNVLNVAERLSIMHERLEGQILEVERRHETLERRTLAQKTDLERLIDRMRVDLEAARGHAASAEMLPSTRRGLGYKAFEDRHRGSPEEIRKLLSIYLPHLRGRRRVLDVGCGRGELLEMLAEEGVSAYGIDPDEAMVQAARGRGAEVLRGDAVQHLAEIEAGSIDGIICTQVVEHLETSELVAFVELAHRKLAPGGIVILETPNPESLFIFHAFFYVDLTHVRPIHPEALKWLLEVTGFDDVRIERILPAPEGVALDQIPRELIDSEKVWHTLATNIVRLNALLYGPQHYAAFGTKGAGSGD